MASKKVLVTVGTTKFENLIETVTQKEILKKLHGLGFSYILLQTGSGSCTETSHDSVKLEYVPYIEDFVSKIKEVDLVISHAGAGTCLEVLRQGKPLIVVVNEDLMDNHQTELAEQLQQDGYVYFCVCNSLKNTLDKDINQLKSYPVLNPVIFSSYLDKCMGFT